ncbi:MAG: Kazal-type serine protease inhibitor [Imperialibacter sp.]|uniref:Kazal-type serine protease inhibitor family protein n=1 Tax=Imperialibacter sp. TaxID=2038411 RepID=UPI0032EDDC88
MITYLIILISTLLNPCEKLSLSDEITTRELIAVVELSEEGDNYIIFNIIQSYKGFAGNQLAMRGEFQFEPEIHYLIFADLKNSRYELNPCSWTQNLHNVSQQTFMELSNLVCFDPEEVRTGACDRSWSPPVCGCNGKEYNNMCEMHNEGIMKYTRGKCQ